MGSNRWRDAYEWPPADARPVNFYLEGKGRANSLDGDGSLVERTPGRQAQDHYVFDPRDPVPTVGGAVCCNPKIFPWGPIDQRPVERRQDVLVYTTRALAEDTEVIGPVQVVLYVATSARDTDFTAKLVDVAPGRLRPQSHGRHSAPALSRFTGTARAGQGRRDLPDRRGCRGHRATRF